MATKTIKAWIDGAVQEIEVEALTSDEQQLSYEERLDVLEATDVTTSERLDELEDKPIITAGNFLVGNGTEDFEEMTPEHVLAHINGTSVKTLTTEEYEALTEDDYNANTLYMLTDSESEYYTKVEIDEQIAQLDENMTSVKSAMYEEFYTKVEVDNLELVTTADIDTICGAISFSIDGAEYLAKENMTWTEWVNSGYNTDGYYVETSQVKLSSNEYITIVGVKVGADETIIADKSYNLLIEFSIDEEVKNDVAS